MDYVDLYLIHWPVALNPNGNNPKFPSLESGKRDIDNSTNPVEVYSKLQAFVKDGRAKSIGVSNFSIKNLKKVLDAESTTIKPVVNQVELHPYLPQPELLKFAKQNDIYLEAYSPLGSTDSPFYKDETLIELGKKYDAPVATILISWAEARDTIVLPKSVTPSRIESNLKVVKLDSEDIEKINNLHKSHGIKRLVDPDFSPVVIFDTSD